MKTNTSKKNHYVAPKVECIQLDNDISLALQSDWGTPPVYEQLANEGSQLLSNQLFGSL